MLLALIVAGGAFWLIRRQGGASQGGAGRGGAGLAGPDSGLPPGLLAIRGASQPIPPARRADGRLVVSGLSKRYGTAAAVTDLSFAVEPGRVTGVLGPNGAGKTTTLRMLLDLVTPTAGSATIGGVRYSDLDEPIRRVAAVLESSGAHPGRTGRNHLRIICRAAGLPLTRADEVLELTGLTAAADRRFREYSLGMRQRLGIAAALLGDPQVLILDEPSNGLDPAGVRWLRDSLRALAAEGRTILVSSHALAEMAQLADDLIIIATGRLVAHGSVDSVLASLGRQRRTLVRTPDLPRLLAALDGDVVVTPAVGGDVLLAGVDAAAIGDGARRAGVAIHQLTTQRAELEDAFLELTEGQEVIR